MEGNKKCIVDDCQNMDILRLQVKDMLSPLEKAIGVMADRWESAGRWIKVLGSIVTLILGWGVWVLGDLNITLREFGILATKNETTIADHKDSSNKEHLDLSGRIEETKNKADRVEAWVGVVQDRVIKLEKEIKK